MHGAIEKHPAHEVLCSLALGRLEDASVGAVEEHVAGCEECARVLAEAQGDSFTALLRAAQSFSDTSLPGAEAVTLATPMPVGKPDLTAVWAVGVESGSTTPPPALGDHTRYRLVRPLGHGGMGSVWLAEHKLMGRMIAVKVIRPEILAKPGAGARFQREANSAARLHHANIVTAFDFEQVGDTYVLAMEYVEGTSLADEVRQRGPLPVEEACECIRQAALGLQHAHEKGLVHRDLKPQNLMRTADGTVKILDFGLAVPHDAGTVGGLTGVNMVVGTPDYIAPEQAEDSRKADVRSDIYSLGCSLYHLLTGSVPFPGDSVLRKLDAHRTQEPTPMRKLRPDIPEGLVAVVAKMMAKRPGDRYQSATAIVDALTPFTQSVPPLMPRRPVATSLIGLLFTGLVVLAGVVLYVVTDNGTIEVRFDDEKLKENEKIEVIAASNGKTITLHDFKNKQTWVVDTGEWTVRLDGNPAGLELEMPHVFTLKRGGRKVVTVRRVKGPDIGQKERQHKVGQTDHELLQGSWQGVAAELSGQPVPKEFIETLRPTLTFAPDKFTAKPNPTMPVGAQFLEFAAQNGLLPKEAAAILTKGIEGIYHVDPTKTPKTIDIVYLGAVRKTLLGIYTLEGDTLKLCLTIDPDSTKDRPSEFTSKKGSTHAVVALKRQGTRVGAAPVQLDEVRRFEGHTAPVFCVAYAPNGRYALSGAGGSFQDGKPIPGKEDSTLRLWDLTTGKEVQRFVGHDSYVRSVAFAPNSATAVSGSHDGTIRLWDVQTGNELVKFDGPGSYVHAVAFAPDGSSVLSGSYDGTVRLWDPKTGKEVRRFTGHKGVVTAVAYSPNGQRALSGGQDCILRLWDVETGKELKRFEAHGNWILTVAYSSDDRHALIAAVYENACWLYDLETGTRRRCLQGGTDWISTVALSPDGRRALICGNEKVVRLWDVHADRELATLSGHAHNVSGVAFSADGRQAVSAGIDKTVRLWRLPESPPAPDKIGEVLRMHDQGNSIWSADVSADGKYCLSASGPANLQGTKVRLIDLRTGAIVRESVGGYVVAFANEGKWIVNAGYDATVVVSETATGKEVRRFQAGWPLFTARVLPDGKRALVVSRETTQIWDLDTGKQGQGWQADSSKFTLRATADGKHFLYSVDGSLPYRVLNLQSGKEEKLFERLVNEKNLVFFPGGRHGISHDNVLTVFETATGKELKRVDVSQFVKDVGRTVMPDDQRFILVARNDSTVVMFETATGKELCRFAMVKGETPDRNLLLSPDGRHAVGATSTGRLYIWRLPEVRAR